MAITNGNTTLVDIKARLAIIDTIDDAALELAVNAASRRIDAYCGQRFYQDATVQAREFYPADPVTLDFTYAEPGEPRDGISTATGLIVKIDTDNDGTFETTLTSGTDFLLTPRNAATRTPVWPYTGLRLITSSLWYFPRPYYGRPSVQVTAKWGWPAVPDDVTQACMIFAVDLFKSKDAPFGVAGSTDFGVLRVQDNRQAKALLDTYRMAAVG